MGECTCTAGEVLDWPAAQARGRAAAVDKGEVDQLLQVECFWWLQASCASATAMHCVYVLVHCKSCCASRGYDVVSWQLKCLQYLIGIIREASTHIVAGQCRWTRVLKQFDSQLGPGLGQPQNNGQEALTHGSCNPASMHSYSGLA